MGRRVTWIVVAAVAALAVAATVEALQGDPEARPPTTTRERPAPASAPSRVPISGQEEVRGFLEMTGVSGVLYLGDPNCRLRTLVLPAVEWRSEPDRPVPCRFTVDQAGAVHPDRVQIEPQNGLRAVCRRTQVSLFDRGGMPLIAFPDACAPAWRPNGTLTFVRKGELVLVLDGRTQRVLLSESDVVHALGTGSRLLEVAWFDNEEFAASVRRGSQVSLAVFRGTELVLPPSFSSPRIDELQATRGAVAARTATRGPAITFFSRAGRQIATVEGGHSFSWSPGGTVAAVAASSLIVFVDPLRSERAALALVATDLEWR